LKHHEPAFRDAPAIDTYLRRIVAERWSSDSPTRLIESIEYSLHTGGKRLRPALVLESFRACGGSDAPGSAFEDAMACAAAVELVHTFSLVHDDLPAMDDDELRRGQPTNHVVFGEAMAILAGDAMLAMAFELLAANARPALAPGLIRELAGATGPAGMIGGQARDIESEGRQLSLEQLRAVHRMKTGALITCACRMGALCAEADESATTAVTRFGQHLGLAFQIIDDMLDVTSSREQLGKWTGRDASRGKNTYPGLLGLEAARAGARDECLNALAALSPFGQQADPLRGIVSRSRERIGS
jgi:geranylgeranyl diphosphate synthase type II